jgi:asparagine synthase (glutamine-hydrolysing)
MPGICGIATTSPADTPSLIGAMASRQQHYPWQKSHTWVSSDGHVGLATVTLDSQAAAGVGELFGVALAFDGELYAAKEARAHLARHGVHFISDSILELLMHGLTREGPQFLASLHGCFAAAMWDQPRQQLRLVSDRFGMRPLYWAQVNGALVFASEIKALLAVPGLSRATSADGLAQFFAFGQYLGDRTSFDAISVLPAASILEFDLGTGRVQVQSYGAVEPAPDLPATREATLDAVAEAFVASVERQTSETPGLGLSLSGGLDARTILAVVPGHSRLTTVSLGIPGSIDHRAAELLSALAGRPHHAQMLDGSFLGGFEEHLRQMVRLTDGQYLDQGIVLTTLPAYRELGIATLLRGHAGELLHMRKAYAFSLDAEALTARDQPALDAWLWRHLSGYMVGAVEGPLFADSAGGPDVLERARTALRARLAETRDVSPPVQRVWQLFAGERLRRETALSLQMFRSFAEVRVPYLDPGLVSLLMALPPALKLDDTLQSHILRVHRPAFLRVVNANTGAPMGASALQTRVASLRMKVYAKLGVPGYQPYERLGLWLAQDLRPLVHRLLLSDRFLARGLFVPEAVARIVSQHEARTHNHTFLLMAMLIFEITQNELNEGQALAGRGAA